MKIIYDFGACVGDNIPYYLLKSDLVIAIEANPSLVERIKQKFEKEFLGEIPINPEVGKTSDEGKPIVEANPEHEISKIYLKLANKIKSTYL